MVPLAYVLMSDAYMIYPTLLRLNYYLETFRLDFVRISSQIAKATQYY